MPESTRDLEPDCSSTSFEVWRHEKQKGEKKKSSLLIFCFILSPSPSLSLSLPFFFCLPTPTLRMTHFFIRLLLLLIRTIINKAFRKMRLELVSPQGWSGALKWNLGGPRPCLASVQVTFKYSDPNYHCLSLMRRFAQGYNIIRVGTRDKRDKV